MSNLNFKFHEGRALAALSFVARTHPGLTPLYVAKIMYFAERWHINRYGRPITADDYVAMPAGPVPSSIKDLIDGNWNWVRRPDGIELAFTIDHGSRYSKLMPGSADFDLSDLSASDLECIQEAIAYCVVRSPDQLSVETHQHAAWQQAPRNRSMDYALFIDEENPNKEEIAEILREEARAAA